MDTRASPEEVDERERPRRIDGPTATSSQSEAQPQMAYLHNNGDDSGAQSPADADLGNSPHNPCRRDTPPSPDRTPKVSGSIHCDSGWTPGAAFPWERLIVVGRGHDDGRLAKWIYDMLSGRWTQSWPMDDGTGPGTRAPVPGTPRGPAGVAPGGFPQLRENVRSPVTLDPSPFFCTFPKTQEI